MIFFLWRVNATFKYEFKLKKKNIELTNTAEKLELLLNSKNLTNCKLDAYY